MLLHLIDLSVLFKGYSSPIINTHYGYDASIVSGIEGAKDADGVRKIVSQNLGVDNRYITDEDLKIVQWACEMVATRAAALAACAVAAVVLHTGNDKVGEGEKDQGVDVGLDGRYVQMNNRYMIGVDKSSVAEFLPGFEGRVRDALRILLGEAGEKRVRMGLAKDGSGVGAALTALQAKKALDSTHRKHDEQMIPGKSEGTGNAGSGP